MIKVTGGFTVCAPAVFPPHPSQWNHKNEPFWRVPQGGVFLAKHLTQQTCGLGRGCGCIGMDQKPLAKRAAAFLLCQLAGLAIRDSSGSHTRGRQL